MADVILNPAVPYSGNIPGGMFPNKTIYIQGFVPPQSDRFHVNLQSGVGDVPNIALHFNPRFQGGQSFVVCNTKTGGKWGAEERQNDNVPFGHGRNFELVILCELNEFKVAVNGRHFMDYKHRVANLQQITAVSVAGNVKINVIRFHPPSAGWFHGQPGTQIASPSTPYTGPIGASGLQYGTMINIKLTVNPNPNRFAINMNGAYYGPQQDDIAFHFNPRFPERTIVRNSKQNNKWGKEERGGTFPFAPNGTHEVAILCLRKCYRVQVDGHHVIDYDHRHDVETVKSVSVSGDVTVKEINID